MIIFYSKLTTLRYSGGFNVRRSRLIPLWFPHNWVSYYFQPSILFWVQAYSSEFLKATLHFFVRHITYILVTLKNMYGLRKTYNSFFSEEAIAIVSFLPHSTVVTCLLKYSF